MSLNRKKEIQEEIDNYKDTLYAIIGFMNLYRFDDESGLMRPDVVLFQGRRLSPKLKKAESDVEQDKSGQSEWVTPDIGILLPTGIGVIGEVKTSFPEDRAKWISDFKQLMKYDRDLEGWPSASGTVSSHDIVLILHYSRSVAVRKFYEEKIDSEVRFVP